MMKHNARLNKSRCGPISNFWVTHISIYSLAHSNINGSCLLYIYTERRLWTTNECTSRATYHINSHSCGILLPLGHKSTLCHACTKQASYVKLCLSKKNTKPAINVPKTPQSLEYDKENVPPPLVTQHVHVHQYSRQRPAHQCLVVPVAMKR